MTVLAIFLVVTVVLGVLTMTGRSADSREDDKPRSWHR